MHGVTKRSSIGPKEKQQGATVVEFSIVAFVFFAVISGLIDLGMAYFRYSLLTNAVIEASRDATALVPTGTTCADVEASARRFAVEYLRKTIRFLDGYHVTAVVDDTFYPPILRTAGSWTLGCLICFSLRNIVVRATSVGMIENAELRCNRLTPSEE